MVASCTDRGVNTRGLARAAGSVSGETDCRAGKRERALTCYQRHLGPLFDSLGLAYDKHNRARVDTAVRVLLGLGERRTVRTFGHPSWRLRPTSLRLFPPVWPTCSDGPPNKRKNLMCTERPFTRPPECPSASARPESRAVPAREARPGKVADAFHVRKRRSSVHLHGDLPERALCAWTTRSIPCSGGSSMLRQRRYMGAREGFWLLACDWK